MSKDWRFYSITLGDDFDENVMVVSFIIGDARDGEIITKRIVGVPSRSNWAGMLNEAITELRGECVQIKHSDLKRMYDENYVGENG
jgi:hypothetical protein